MSMTPDQKKNYADYIVQHHPHRVARYLETLAEDQLMLAGTASPEEAERNHSAEP